MNRREFPARVKVAAYERSGGFCEACNGRLQVGRIHYDHRIPDALGGEPTYDNCAVLCTHCHAQKTTGEDVPRISKMKRQRAAHLGAKTTKRPMPGSRASGLKKHMDGRVTRRGEL